MNVTLWHNPGCGSSKNALDYLRDKGIEPTIYLYLKEKPDAAVLTQILTQLKAKPSDILRPKEKLGEDLGLYAEGVPEETILAAMAANAKLIQRPVAITDKGAVIARPKTKIDEIL
ncbi:MAG TPA: arsenate reductase (glutaredoxin) [Hyphomonadaceae bacterium]|nr:arsenate reductase (glutaredoxin) [Hyphomonadaceae bacterium]